MKSHKPLPRWTVDSSAYIVNDRFLKLRADNCTTPQGGKVNQYYVLEYGDWVNCIALDAEDNVIMLKHYRHGVQEYLMEFIGGGIEAGEQPEAAARRELQEEVGYTGGTLYHVGTSYANPSNHTNKVHTFLAVGGAIDQAQDLEVGETLTVEKIPLKTVIAEMSRPESVYPALYVAALFHVLSFIRVSDDVDLGRLRQYI